MSDALVEEKGEEALIQEVNRVFFCCVIFLDQFGRCCMKSAFHLFTLVFYHGRSCCKVQSVRPTVGNEHPHPYLSPRQAVCALVECVDGPESVIVGEASARRARSLLTFSSSGEEGGVRLGRRRRRLAEFVDVQFEVPTPTSAATASEAEPLTGSKQAADLFNKAADEVRREMDPHGMRRGEERERGVFLFTSKVMMCLASKSVVWFCATYAPLFWIW